MSWDLDGNGSIGAGNWLGTRNGAPLIIRTENGGGSPTAGAEALRVTAAAQGRAVCVGTQTPGPGAKLTVAGGDITWANNSRLQRDQGGSIELGGDGNTPGTGTPYIDFHFQGLTQDFNTRIINDANGQLTISAGTVRALGNINVRGDIRFTNAATPMMFIFESGTQNPERPVIAHSPAFPNWGLSYRDVDDTMIFQQSGQPVLAVALGLGSGNVGIGMSTPSQRLTVGSGNVLLPNANAGTDGNLYFGGRTDAGQIGLRLFGGLVNGTIPAGFIDVRTTTPSDGLRIRVDTNVGSTERMRVTSNNIQFFVPTSGASDVRMKTSIRRLDRVLDKLDSVRGVAFSLAESPQTPGHVAGRPGIGVIAQEVEESFPELVSTFGDHGYKAVDYSGLSGVLIEAVKELKAENEAFRSRIATLEAAPRSRPS